MGLPSDGIFDHTQSLCFRLRQPKVSLDCYCSCMQFCWIRLGVRKLSDLLTHCIIEAIGVLHNIIKITSFSPNYPVVHIILCDTSYIHTYIHTYIHIKLYRYIYIDI